VARAKSLPWLLLPGSGHRGRMAPSLLGCLAGDAEPGADLSPGVPGVSQAGDGLGYGIVDVVDQADHVGERLDIAGGDAAAVGREDAPGERGLLGVLGDRPPPLWCQAVVDSVFGSAGGLRGAGLAGTGGHGVSWAVAAGGIAPGGLHPLGADHCLERESSRAWPRSGFQDALAVPGLGGPGAALTRQESGQRSWNP
jgi:hypothetical protein